MPAKYSASCASCGGAAAVSSVRALVRSTELLESLLHQYQHGDGTDNVVETSDCGVQMSAGAVLNFERELRLWREGNLLRCRSRQRELLSIDCRESVCKLFGMKPGMRVRTSRGIARVVGVANGFLWYRLEGDQVRLLCPHSHSRKQKSKWQSYKNLLSLLPCSYHHYFRAVFLSVAYGSHVGGPTVDACGV